MIDKIELLLIFSLRFFLFFALVSSCLGHCVWLSLLVRSIAAVNVIVIVNRQLLASPSESKAWFASVECCTWSVRLVFIWTASKVSVISWNLRCSSLLLVLLTYWIFRLTADFLCRGPHETWMCLEVLTWAVASLPHKCQPPSPPLDNIRVMVIVWTLEVKR